MKQITPLFLLVVLFFASCISEETIQPEETSLKSYKVTKDSQGRYTIDYEVEENTATTFVKNEENNFNEIYLYEGNATDKTSEKKSLSIENSILKLGLYEDGEQSKSIIIEDDNIVLAKGQESDEFLDSYSIQSLEDGVYQLDFEVKEGIAVWAEYNEEDDAYEIHLKEGTSNELEFSKTYVKTSERLKINFVNHIDLNSAKSESTNSIMASSKKPRVVIVS